MSIEDAPDLPLGAIQGDGEANGFHGDAQLGSTYLGRCMRRQVQLLTTTYPRLR